MNYFVIKYEHYFNELRKYADGFKEYVAGKNKEQNRTHYYMFLYLEAKMRVAKLNYKLEFTNEPGRINSRISAEKALVDIYFRRLMDKE